jgi:dTDP-4-amino-4,6-dideoxygalactose transaminase
MSPKERELLLDAFDSNWVAPLGPHVDAFEREFAQLVGSSHAVSLSSGTAALHLALVGRGVGAGDDVWTSSLTFAATANAIVYTGASPVFVDSETTSWCMDPALLEDELARANARGRLPKAVVPVDIYGQCADYARIGPVCERYGVVLVEDAAEALGATYREKSAGTFGDAGIFSFNGNKIITTGGGGMLVTEDGALAKMIRHLATQAREPFPHYEHERIGYNYRLSNLLAAVGRGQISVLKERVAARRLNNQLYRDHLGDEPGLRFLTEAPGRVSTHWLTCIQVDPSEFGTDRERIRTELLERGIEARPVWKPMHLQPIFKDARKVGGAVCEGLFANGLCLPSGSDLTRDELLEVVSAIREVGTRARRKTP